MTREPLGDFTGLTLLITRHILGEDGFEHYFREKWYYPSSKGLKLPISEDGQVTTTFKKLSRPGKIELLKLWSQLLDSEQYRMVTSHHAYVLDSNLIWSSRAKFIHLDDAWLTCLRNLLVEYEVYDQSSYNPFDAEEAYRDIGRFASRQPGETFPINAVLAKPSTNAILPTRHWDEPWIMQLKFTRYWVEDCWGAPHEENRRSDI